MTNVKNQVCFSVNENDWIMLSEKLDSVIIRALKIKILTKNKKISGNRNHRNDEAEAKGTVRVRSKLYDTSNFFDN